VNEVDHDSILFSVDLETVLVTNKSKSLYLRSNPNYFFIFGDSDLLIHSNANTNPSNMATIGKSYELPKGCSEKLSESFLAGESRFYVREIEVFRCY